MKERFILRTQLQLTVCALVLLIGCSQNYSDDSAKKALREQGLDPVVLVDAHTPDKSHGSPAENEGRINLGGISVSVPEGWESVQASGMRIAEFRLPGENAGSKEGVLAVFQLGGSVEGNIARWYGQMSQPDGGSTEERARRWEKQVDGMPATLVDLQGTYAGMGAMGRAVEPQANYRMLAAVVEAPRGLFFFKLVGPNATLALWQESFEHFIANIKKE